jgi:hypothetical protein
MQLTGCRITDDGVMHLLDLVNLETLSLARTSIGDAGLVQLTQLPALGRLFVDQTQVSDAGVARFEAASPDCQLSLRGYGSLVD